VLRVGDRAGAGLHAEDKLHPTNLNNLTSLKRVSFILLLVVLLPALFYSGYEISTLSSSERIFGAMYRQQLDALLFSLNQYSWDAVSAWAGGLQNIVSDRSSASDAGLERGVDKLLATRNTIQAVFVSDTAFRKISTIVPQGGGAPPSFLTEDGVRGVLRKNSAKIERLIEYQAVEYRKLEPLPVDDPEDGEAPLLLAFIARDFSSTPRVIGIVFRPADFISKVLSRKLSEAAGSEFVLAVVDTRTHRVLRSTEEVQPSELKQQKALWLFPNLALGIRLKGSTVDELVESRAYRNLGIIAVLDILLLSGAWLVYRTMRREMELIQLKSDFISNVSHELRTPLSLIRMFAETLEMKRVKTEKQRFEYYRTIIQETERLSRLVNNLLNFSRMDAGRRSYNMQPTDLNELVSKVVGFYTIQLRNHEFELVVDLATSLPPVPADGEAIAEALHNLIDNAVKYSTDDKYIRIATGVEAGVAFVEVQDKGIGIAPENHGKIFEKFYRVSSGLVHTTKGSGLGLALVDHIIGAHGGRVEVRSALGQGSTFRLLLPLAAIPSDSVTKRRT